VDNDAGESDQLSPRSAMNSVSAVTRRPMLSKSRMTAAQPAVAQMEAAVVEDHVLGSNSAKTVCRSDGSSFWRPGIRHSALRSGTSGSSAGCDDVLDREAFPPVTFPPRT